jgi:hypothetical protein
MVRSILLMLLAAAACGGSKGQVADPEPPLGESTATPSSPAAPPALEPAPPAPAEETSAPPTAPVTFVLENEGEGELNFGVTKGWGLVLFSYTGKPPKAKAVILFEAACTASCDAPPAEVCPSCPEPQTKKEEQAMARIETVPAGGSISVPWDGKILVYDKAPGKKRCKCWHKMDPPADTYTIKACGLRAPKEAGKPSLPVCTETQVALGPGELPAQINLTFAK